MDDAMREALWEITKQARVGRPGSSPTRSKWVTIPAHVYHKAVAVLAAAPAQPSQAGLPDREALIELMWAHGLADVKKHQRASRFGYLTKADFAGLADAILASIRLPVGKRRGIYAASRASVPERVAMWHNLRSSGVQINSTWIDEAAPGASACLADLWVRIEREIKASERLILYAEASDFPLKGALIEAGIAISAGVPVFVVLPDVELEHRSMRPLGSWAMHPLVSICPAVDAALTAISGGPHADASKGEE